MIELSVSIITHNRRELLRKVISSLEEQTYPKDKFEVVVVDDGSSDGTPRVMKDIVKDSSCNIRYIREEKNQGKAFVRNISIEKAKGEVILFLEDDTIADERLLEKHMEVHSSGNKKLAVLGEQVRPANSIQSPFGKFIVNSSRNFFENVQKIIKEKTRDSFKAFITFNLSINRSFLIEKGMFDPEFKYFCEDIELGYRLAGDGLELEYNEGAIVFDFHPPFFSEYCSRNVNRGYYNVKLNEKHPGVIEVYPVRGNLQYFCKDLMYPALGLLINFLDKYLKVPMPDSLYSRVLDYYLEKGIRKARL